MAYLTEKINGNIKIEEHTFNDHENSLKENIHESKEIIYTLKDNTNIIDNKQINKNKINEPLDKKHKNKENIINNENMGNEKSEEKMKGTNDKNSENENIKSPESLMSDCNSADNLKKDMKDNDIEEKIEDKNGEKEKKEGDISKKNISIELLKICDALKNVGNKYFKENNYIVSLKYYTEAINLLKKFYDNTNVEILKKISIDNLQNEVSVDEVDKDLFNEYYTKSTVSKKDNFISIKETDLHIYYTNRSFCHMKLESYGLSIQDIDEAIKINPFYAKAYYRKGCSYLLLSDLKSASECFQKVLKLTKDTNSEIKLKQCKKLLFEQHFQKAIELEQKMPYYQTLVLDTLKIENTNAPIYDRNNLNIDFLKKVVDYISVPNQKLNKKCVCAIVLDVINLLKELPTLVYLNLQSDETLTICGDVHGQFYDLLNIMNINGYPSENNSYLFNGDFVDRGSFSVEVIIFLYLAKLTFPNNVHLTRGNHETDNMNKLYGFLGELQEKYDDKLHTLFSDSFKFLPLAYVLNKTIFICHGGIPSKMDTTLEDIQKIDRNTEPLDEGVMTDLLWSDPNEEKGFKPSKRGIGFSFGTDITENFLKRNNLSLIIRSHEVRDEGYSIEQNGMLYTVFSAPNYCDIMKNKGAFLKFKGSSTKPECVTFTEVKHPDVPSLKYAHNLYQNI
ncbi:serine/threonine protein phosphatase 5, putative [Plasmodium relictum]|uniref:Serine/threonine-protein phosphatase T n=1 Tax=Plasmodium relictum TaxID=85471 RepID=A0A1J1H7P8_PLARL|nr:serine/threonine protein phosphatase 5, putative [Plasmodium relictum]CRH00804.1 serine/threonine protein phosphatase 5, putative [Plasmodium relictum]